MNGECVSPVVRQLTQQRDAAQRDCAKYADRVSELEQSLTEQARLVGMGAEREAALLAKVAELERGLAEAREIIGDLVNHARGAEVLLKIPQQETTSKAVAFLADHAAMAHEEEK